MDDDVAAALADSSSDQDDATINFQAPKKRRNGKNNAKRFSDDQIKSLESIFEVETKLEPKKKVQLAKDLGLQPRQVAIWFQNRRARWKSKQIEQDYRVLKASYDHLQLQFDDLKRENQSLQIQLQELSGLLEKVDLSDRDGEVRGNPSSRNEEIDRNNSKQVIKSFGKMEEEEMLSWDEEQDITNLAGPQTWCNLSSAGIFDQSSTTSEWWENE